MTSIEISNLSHCFSDGTLGIEGIDLTIAPGELVVIAGPNGSGKTTLLMHINGLLLPFSGQVRLADMDVAHNQARARQMVGMVFQNADSQIVGETVYDDAAFGPENLGLTPEAVKQRASDALNAVGLNHLAHQRPHLLSGGEKRKLAIAGVLAMEPQVLMLDEPFAGLDYPGIQQVLKQILLLHSSGYTILITTHDLEKIIAHAQRLVVMHHGRIVRNGVPTEILNDVERFGIRRPCAARFGLEVVSWLS